MHDWYVAVLTPAYGQTPVALGGEAKTRGRSAPMRCATPKTQHSLYTVMCVLQLSLAEERAAASLAADLERERKAKELHEVKTIDRVKVLKEMVRDVGLLSMQIHVFALRAVAPYTRRMECCAAY